jgi:predicted signal transduction protein with EAL and GGDEF domain
MAAEPDTPQTYADANAEKALDRLNDLSGRERVIQMEMELAAAFEDGARVGTRKLDMADFFPIAEDRVRGMATILGDEAVVEVKETGDSPNKWELSVTLAQAADALKHLNEILH